MKLTFSKCLLQKKVYSIPKMKIAMVNKKKKNP